MKNERKLFEEPTLDVVEFEETDIITTSDDPEEESNGIIVTKGFNIFN